MPFRLVYGLSAALYSEIKDGAIEQTSFDSYNVLRMDGMPRAEATLVPSGGFWAALASRPLRWRRRRC